MVNVLNKNHPKYCELTDLNIEALNCLHFIMKCLKYDFDNERELISEQEVQGYVTSCRYLEFQMQEQWGFDQDENFHTHIRHFRV